MTINEFADLIGKSRSAWLRRESGEVPLTVNEIEEIAEKLNKKKHYRYFLHHYLKLKYIKMKKLSIIITLITLLLSCSKQQNCYETNKSIYKSKIGLDWIERQSIGIEKIDNEKSLRDYIKDSLKITPCY